jgi:hypothetical protein
MDKIIEGGFIMKKLQYAKLIGLIIKETCIFFNF